MMLCYFKNPVPGQWKYCISSMNPKTPDEIYETIVESSPDTTVGSLFPNELQIS
jgi:cell division protease FtsH